MGVEGNGRGFGRASPSPGLPRDAARGALLSLHGRVAVVTGSLDGLEQASFGGRLLGDGGAELADGGDVEFIAGTRFVVLESRGEFVSVGKDLLDC